MTQTAPPANWYPDPAAATGVAAAGGLRFWDGTQWTDHVAQPATVLWGPPPWKGAGIGRPPFGPGSLADPGRRLGARVLDLAIVFVPVLALLLTVTLLIAAPHFGPIFPTVPAGEENAPAPFPGVLWIELTVFGCAAVAGIVMVAYQTIATATFGRTLGKALLRIRPVGQDLAALGWGRSFVRALVEAAAWILGIVGIIDPLWCLWDDNRQCLHDKAADSIVINDLPEPPGSG